MYDLNLEAQCASGALQIGRPDVATWAVWIEDRSNNCDYARLKKKESRPAAQTAVLSLGVGTTTDTCEST